MPKVMSALKNHSKGYPKIAISTPIQKITTKVIGDHGHNLARRSRVLLGRCVPHHVNGLFILVAVTLAKIAKNIGAKPPPTNHSMSERRNNTHAPYFLSTNAAAHIVTNKPTIIATIPVTKKLGMIVIARSVPYSQNLCAGPIASISIPFGLTFP